LRGNRNEITSRLLGRNTIFCLTTLLILLNFGVCLELWVCLFGKDFNSIGDPSKQAK